MEQGNCICNHSPYELSVYQGHIYFIEGGMWRADINGDNPMSLQGVSSASFFCVCNDNIYYTVGNSLYRCDLDGNNRKLLDGSMSYGFIREYEGRLYVTDATSGIYSVNLAGSDRTLVVNVSTTCFDIYKGVIYFKNSEYDSKLYSVPLGGGTPVLMFNQSVDWIRTKLNRVWFKQEQELYSVALDGGDVRAEPNIKTGNFDIAGGMLYYAKFADKLYKTPLDSSYLSSMTPVISDSDRDLGEFTDFPNFYIHITNNVSAYISAILDGSSFYACSTQGNCTLNTAELMGDRNIDEGKHTLTIIASNELGQRATRTYTFKKGHINSNPVISDSDRSLGDKNLHFSVSYKVSDTDAIDSLTVTEKLNGNVVRTLSNAPRDTDLIIHITDEVLYKLPLNSENKITIQVDDGHGGTSYRNYNFKRTNTAPVLDGADKDLGVVTRDVSEKYSVYDQEGNPITVVEKVDDDVLKTFTAEAKKEYTTSIPLATWLGLTNGKHTLTVNATDSNNATSIRTFTFEKKEDKIILDLKKPFITDAKANKILITPVWGGIENATIKVETCNNALDTAPTWEDCTKEILVNQKYTFTNKEKTGEKWGINLRFTLERKPNTTGEIFITGFGGAFE